MHGIYNIKFNIHVVWSCRVQISPVLLAILTEVFHSLSKLTQHFRFFSQSVETDAGIIS
jgi:hypothetical protein